MREKGQTEVAKTLETPVFSRGIEILTEKLKFARKYVTVFYKTRGTDGQDCPVPVPTAIPGPIRRQETSAAVRSSGASA